MVHDLKYDSRNFFTDHYTTKGQTMRNVEIQKQISGLKELLVNSESLHDEILDFQAACEFLKMSSSYLYKLTHKRIIPCFKPGGKKLFFSKIELIKWVKSSRNLTNQEIEKKASDYIKEIDKKKNRLSV